MLLVMALSLSAGSVYAKDRDQGILLRGTVGADAVVMQLGDGVYFYEKDKLDIALEPEQDDETTADEDKSTAQHIRLVGTWKGGHFDLIQDGDRFKGTFTDDGKTVPVELHTVDAKTLPDPLQGLELEDMPLSGYDKLRLANIKFMPGEKETLKGKYTIQWFTEPLSKTATFRVIGGYPKAVMSAINRVIDADAYDRILDDFRCGESDPLPFTKEDNIYNYYLSDHFVSYNAQVIDSCRAGAFLGTRGVTIDARTGKKLELGDLFWIGGKPAKDSEEIDAALRDLSEELNSKQPDDDSGCGEPMGVGEPWFLDAYGLHVSGDYGTANRVCNNDSWLIIPWSTLKENNPELDGK
jgi:hypothetical protein